jgi:hypothetical protein
MEERATLKLSHISKVGGNTKLKIDLLGGVLTSQSVSDQDISATLLGQPIKFGEPGNDTNTGPLAGFGVELESGSSSIYLRGEYISQVYGENGYYGAIGIRYRY